MQSEPSRWTSVGGNGGWGSERAAERLKWLADNDRRKREAFVEERTKLEADFASLPTPLKERIERFRVENPDFRIDGERYELFCCVEAAKFAAAARDPLREGIHAAADFWADLELRALAGGEIWNERPKTPEAQWLLWAWALNTKAYDYNYERQRAVLGNSDQHSGNTFGGAMHLAISLLT